jgi:hypothetical protein
MRTQKSALFHVATLSAGSATLMASHASPADAEKVATPVHSPPAAVRYSTTLSRHAVLELRSASVRRAGA